MAYNISSSTFSISSPMVIKNGTEGYGKILTTDASGLVVWKEPNSFFGSGRYIGELYGGGIVVDFWKEGDVENTLIMSLTHLSLDYVWSNVPTVGTGYLSGEADYSTGAYSLYDGKYNSDLITRQQVVDSQSWQLILLESHTISAAKLCRDYKYGGYDDWYLPSYNEFNSIIKNKHIINRVLGDVDGIRSQNTGSGSALSGLYWTSTEYNERFSSAEESFPGGPIFFYNTNTQYGIQYSTSESRFKAVDKTTNAMVRAIRREEKLTGNGLVLSLDAGNKNSYDDTTKGNIWYDLVNKGITASAGLTFSASATGVTYSATNSGYLTFQNNTTSFIDFKVNLDNTSVVTVEMFARIRDTPSGSIFGWGVPNGNPGSIGYSVLNGQLSGLGFWTGAGGIYGLNYSKTIDYGLFGNWKHYIFVMSSVAESPAYFSNKIYINGDQIELGFAQGSIEGTKSFANGVGRINPNQGGFSQGVSMDLAVFNIYKRELNQTEIVNNFNKYKKRFEVKELVSQKDLILNLNSNNINSFNPTVNPTVWNDTKLTSSTRTLRPVTFVSTATYSKSPGVYPGTSINIDGINRASVASSITFNPSTTWEVWVKFDSFDINPFNMFMGQIQPYFSIRKTQFINNKVLFSNSYSGIVGSTATQSYQFSNSSVVANVWYHLAFTTKYDSVSNTTSSKIYINGLPDYSNSITTNGTNTYDSNSIPGYQLNDYPSYKFTVGDGSNLFPNNNTPTWYPFRGSISEVRIYNRTLSALEIENNYNSSKHLYDIDKNHYTHNFNTSPTFSVFQNLTLDFPNKQNNSILVSNSGGLVSLSTPSSIIFDKIVKRSVGDLYAGGIIVSVVDYLLTTNYLIASLEDLPSFYYWSTLAGSQPEFSTVTSEFNGAYNTDRIKTSLGAGSYAAMTASLYNYGGYTDWYLPSSNELREAYNNISILNLVLGKNSLKDTYWSSSESTYSSEVYPNAFAFNFGSVLSDIPGDIPGLGGLGATSSGLELQVSKYNLLKVRPFRREITNNSPFVTVWKTDNPGSSAANQISIPVIGGPYNYDVDWGDGTTSIGVKTGITKTYATAGTYTVKIKGIFPRIYFSSGGDRLKILQVKNWGSIKWTSFDSAFAYCSNLTIPATDAPDLSLVTNMSQAFAGCTSFNQPINHWNTSSVQNMGSMFFNATSFNQPLNNWNTSAVTNMGYMFANAASFNKSLNSWDVQKVINMSYMFYGCSVFNQPLNSWYTTLVENMTYMFFNCVSFNQPINFWNTSAVTNMANMFNGCSVFNQPLNLWNVELVQNMTYMFANALVFNQSLQAWKPNSVQNMSYMFANAPAFNQPINTIVSFGQTFWNVSSVLDMEGMFSNASAFNQSLNSWNTALVQDMSAMFNNAINFNNGLASGASGPLNFDTRAVINMASMFAGAQKFNQSLTTNGNIWNTSLVQNMGGMFMGAFVFNQPLNSWTTSAVTNMSAMFYGATVFNQPLSNWITSAVTNMSFMFSNTNVFNQPLTTNGNIWNTSSVIYMQSMFDGAKLFNQSLNSWNTALVQDMNRMFAHATVFNNGLSPGASGALNWNTSSLTNTNTMFYNAVSFNQSLTRNVNIWNMSLVIDMTLMFGNATVFNQPLNSWNLGNQLNSIWGMFQNAIAFNQPLNSWNTQSVIYMQYMFEGATAFNQNIGSWNVSNVISFGNFMTNKTPTTFSAANLDAIYIGWSTRPVKPNLSITFGTAKRTLASTSARNILTGSPNLWVITDGGT